ncbi:glycosyltransferase family 4 protein [Paenibacillus sp. CN-4]|uniref:glycosyltransferase family 4 protein n=1 Tax=Paenibacillus nanchangensis TaxID=3348343 RepID=UPI00397A1112
MKRKVLFCATVDYHIKAFHLPYLEWFQDQGWEVHVVANGDINIKHCDKKFNIPISRSPLGKSNIKAYKELVKIVDENNYSIIHCHTPMGGVLARLAARRSRKTIGTKVFYTAHGFHFFKGAPLINWLMYFPIELIFSKYTDVLITINNEDYLRAKSYFKSKKVMYVPGVGIDTGKFKNVEIEKENVLKKLGVQNKKLLLLSVGELNANKNHEVVLKALKLLNDSEIHYVICGEGRLKDYLVALIKELGLQEQVHLLGFRKDIPDICLISDIFIFPSKREGLGLAALEAMAAGLPIVTSNVHGIVDYSINGITGYSTNPKNVEGFANAIKLLATDSKLRNEMGHNNKERVEKYSLENVLNEMKTLYKDVINK